MSNSEHGILNVERTHSFDIGSSVFMIRYSLKVGPIASSLSPRGSRESTAPGVATRPIRPSHRNRSRCPVFFPFRAGRAVFSVGWAGCKALLEGALAGLNFRVVRGKSFTFE